MLAARVEIPVDLYDEEEVWESHTGIMATMPLSLTSEGIPTLITSISGPIASLLITGGRFTRLLRPF